MTLTSVRPRPERIDNKGNSVARHVAHIVAGCLAALIVFQIALALGAPLGRAAWGGDHATLPTNLRVATLVPIVTYTVGAVVVLCRSGYRVTWVSDKLARR